MRKRGWLRALVIIIPFILVFGLGQFIGALISGSNPKALEGQSSFQQMVMSLFSMITTTLLIFVFVRFVDREKFLSIGWHFRTSVSELTWTAIAVVGAFVLGFVILRTTDQLQFKSFSFNLLGLLETVVLFLCVAITEELFVRGYILKNLLQSMDERWALLASSALFCMLHFLNPNLNLLAITNLFLAGILLGVAYLFGRGLWVPICIHFFWNFTQTHLGYAVSGQESYSLISISETKPSIWNGGEFGFEGSILAVLFQLIAIVAMWRLHQKRKSQFTNHEDVLHESLQYSPSKE